MEKKQTAVNFKLAMPKTAEWVTRQRKAFGDKWVTEQIKLGMGGEPGHFYAIEGGHVVGTPVSVLDEWQRFAVVTGCPFAGFMAAPPEAPHAH